MNMRKYFAMKGVAGKKILGYCLNAKGFQIESTIETMNEKDGTLSEENVNCKWRECQPN